MTAPGPDDPRPREPSEEPVDYPADPDEPPAHSPGGDGFAGPAASGPAPPGQAPYGYTPAASVPDAYYPHDPPYAPAPYPSGPYPPPDASYPPGYYPPPGYGGDYYPGAAPPAGTNGTALTALITAVIGVPLCFLCGVPSLVAAVLGVMAMGQTKRTGQDGYGMAVAAVVIGGVTFVLTVVVGLALFLLGNSAVSGL